MSNCHTAKKEEIVMKCYYHNDRDAVSQCGVCGKGLCRECTDRYEEPLCEKCGEEIAAETAAELKETLIRTRKSSKKWIAFSIFAMIFMGLFGLLMLMTSIARGTGIGEALLSLIIFVYIGLALVMGLEKSLNSSVAGLLAFPIIGWIFFLYAFPIVGVIFAIPEFIKLRRVAKETGNAVKKLGR